MVMLMFNQNLADLVRLPRGVLIMQWFLISVLQFFQRCVCFRCLTLKINIDSNPGLTSYGLFDTVVAIE